MRSRVAEKRANHNQKEIAYADLARAEISIIPQKRLFFRQTRPFFFLSAASRRLLSMKQCRYVTHLALDAMLGSIFSFQFSHKNVQKSIECGEFSRSITHTCPPKIARRHGKANINEKLDRRFRSVALRLKNRYIIAPRGWEKSKEQTAFGWKRGQ